MEHYSEKKGSDTTACVYNFRKKEEMWGIKCDLE
jgi:hypothetical protein